MSAIKTLLGERFKPNEETSQKMNQLAKISGEGRLSSFSGIFKVSPVTAEEKAAILRILQQHGVDGEDFEKDGELLSVISSEIKAINNQAILLHGERIKAAQSILKRYKEGAFTEWLITTYGNRQTPYNFLQYYEFYIKLSHEHKAIADQMPKQVIYSLSSRKGDESEKIRFIEAYTGENKQALLEKLRDAFPLSSQDKRSHKAYAAIEKQLMSFKTTLLKRKKSLSQEQKLFLAETLLRLREALNE